MTTSNQTILSFPSNSDFSISIKAINIGIMNTNMDSINDNKMKTISPVPNDPKNKSVFNKLMVVLCFIIFINYSQIYMFLRESKGKLLSFLFR